jgi:hypothetical protein
MRPDPQLALQTALRRGPDFCPPDLFTGSVAAIVRGLRVHANTIAHARHVALEQTYPKLREAIGAEAFHRAAEQHLAGDEVLARSLDTLGEGLHRHLDHAGARDLARLEWAWLLVYHAADATSLDLGTVTALDPEALIALRIIRHPATQIVVHEGDDRQTLLARPDAEVQTTDLTPASEKLLDRCNQAVAMGELLNEFAPAAVLHLISAGALTMPGDVS